MKALIVDANVFLRFFVAGNRDQYKRASELFGKAKKGEVILIIPQIIVFEVNYTLLKYYHFKKDEIIKALNSMVSVSYFEVESKEIFIRALKMYKDTSMDLTDCFLITKREIENIEIFSFDKKLQKYAKDYG